MRTIKQLVKSLVERIVTLRHKLVADRYVDRNRNVEILMRGSSIVISYKDRILYQKITKGLNPSDLTSSKRGAYRTSLSLYERIMSKAIYKKLKYVEQDLREHKNETLYLTDKNECVRAYAEVRLKERRTTWAS